MPFKSVSAHKINHIKAIRGFIFLIYLVIYSDDHDDQMFDNDCTVGAILSCVLNYYLSNN